MKTFESQVFNTCARFVSIPQTGILICIKIVMLSKLINKDAILPARAGKTFKLGSFSSSASVESCTEGALFQLTIFEKIVLMARRENSYCWSLKNLISGAGVRRPFSLTHKARLDDQVDSNCKVDWRR
jgi:hypothetical protein